MSNSARRTSVTCPNGRVVNLSYGSTDSIDDLFSLVKSTAISGESGSKVEYARAGLARFVKIAYPHPGVEMSMIRPGGGSEGDSGDPYDGYDRFGRVQEMRWQNSSTGTPIDAWQWGFNEASNRTWKKNLVAAMGEDEAYAYDGLYQVKRDAVGTLNTNRTAIGGAPKEDETFTYDPTGNWLGYRKDANGSTVVDQARSNNLDNQLTQIDGNSECIEYDRAGNAIKIRPGAGGDWNKHFTLVWDAWNRLVEVKDENGLTVQKNAYDGLSRRITKEAGGTVTHTYWSDRWKPLEERIGSATTAARSYLWGERPGHRDELVLRDRDTNGDGSLDERLYATMDYFNGTAVLNTSGAVQERYAYSAFGVRRIMAADFSPRSTSLYAWDFGFQGQFRDNETGWSNYGYRFYVPVLGRWINRDPIGERGGVDVYGFALNSPINLVDQFGLDSIALNRAGAAGSRKAVEMTLGDPKRGSDGREVRPFQNMGAPLLREYCGLICKFCDQSRGSPRRVIRETPPHPGPWPIIRPDGVDNPTCDPYTNEDTKESVSCEKEFGVGAIEIGTYHSHPTNSPFSKDDKGFARTRGKGNPIFKGTPDGDVEKFTPDLSTKPSQDNLFPGETSRVPTRD